MCDSDEVLVTTTEVERQAKRRGNGDKRDDEPARAQKNCGKCREGDDADDSGGDDLDRQVKASLVRKQDFPHGQEHEPAEQEETSPEGEDADRAERAENSRNVCLGHGAMI